MSTVVALLESMWSWCGSEQEATRWFRINADNFSGRRLYRIVGDANLLVTNSCKELCASANHHGNPDPSWVKENLTMMGQFDLLLVCGRIAKETYEKSGYSHPNVIFMDHPAARRWSNITLDAMTQKVREALQ